MKVRALVVERLAAASDALLAGAKRPEILGSEWRDACEELERDAALRDSVQLNVEVNDGVGGRVCLVKANASRWRRRPTEEHEIERQHHGAEDAEFLLLRRHQCWTSVLARVEGVKETNVPKTRVFLNCFVS